MYCFNCCSYFWDICGLIFFFYVCMFWIVYCPECYTEVIYSAQCIKCVTGIFCSMCGDGVWPILWTLLERSSD